VVAPDGTVLGGNSRTMTAQRVYERGNGDAYRELLKQRAAQFGVDPAYVDSFDKPVLVREVKAPATIEAARQLTSDLNKPFTGALGTSERAVSAARSITPDTLRYISGAVDGAGETGSLRDVLRDNGSE